MKKDKIIIPDNITDPDERKKWYAKEHYRLNKDMYYRNQKKWKDNHKEYVKEYLNEWYKENKGKRITKIIDKNMCLAKEFIKEIELQGGWCNELQAFQLTNIYSDIFNSAWSTKYDDIEDELSYMYLRLKKIVETGSIAIDESGDLLVGSKVCITCKVEKEIREFSKNKKTKDGKSNACKSCITEYRSEYFKKNPDKKIKYQEKWNKKR